MRTAALRRKLICESVPEKALRGESRRESAVADAVRAAGGGGARGGGARAFELTPQKLCRGGDCIYVR